MTGIYKITEIATGLCYIGQSIHCHAQKGGRWRKHHKRFPPALFTYEVLREVSIPQFMNSFEKFYIKLYDSHANGFNGTIGGSGMKVTHPSAETRKKMGAHRVGKAPSNKGTPLSPEQRAKMSAALKGKTISPEHRAQISAALKGRTRSPEHCANMSAAQIGKKRKPHSQETIEKIRAGNIDRTCSPETREKLKAAATAQHERRRQAALEETNVKAI